MKKIIGTALRTMICLTVFAAMMIFLPALTGSEANAVSFTDVNDGVEFNVGTSSDQYYRYEPDDWPKTYREIVFITAVSTGGTPKVTLVDSNGNSLGSSNDMWGGRRIQLGAPVVRQEIYNPFDYVYFKISGGLGSKFRVNSYPYWYNQEKSSASEIADKPEVRDFADIAERDTGCSYGTLWYRLKAEEKAKYRISTTVKSYYYCIDNEKAVYVPDSATKTVTVNKGSTLYIELMADEENADTLKISRDIFNRMTTMKLDASTYSLTEGKSKTITLKYSKLDANRPLESTIVSSSVGGDCKLVKESVGETSAKYTLSGKNPGKFKITVTNSEGLKATAVVNVVPKKMNVAGASSEGTHKSSKVHWGTQIGASKYAVYLKNSSGKYVKKGTTAGTDYNIKGLKANKTYYVKLAAVKTGEYNGTSYSIEGALSDPIKIVTAPSKKPVIRKATSTGTKYHRATSRYQVGHWDAGGVWHKGYYITTPAHSTAAVKVKHSKVKGASSYVSNGISFSKGIAGYSIGGKVSAGKKQTVKIRAVRKSGTSIAYGPWSKAKTVRLKGAK